MDDVEEVLARLDDDTADLARRALGVLLGAGATARPWRSLRVETLRAQLGRAVAGDQQVPAVEQHEALWALGDFFDAAGRPSMATVCRAPETHARLAVRPLRAVRAEQAATWSQGLRRGRAELWDEALSQLADEPVVPRRLALALNPVGALLAAVADGVPLTSAGHLPPRLALELDTKFGWSDEYSSRPPRGETDLPTLLFLREHLQAQGLLVVEERTLRVATEAVRIRRAPERLWAAVVAARPRWQAGFEEDALAVLAATLLRGPELTRGQLREEMAYLVGGKWRGTAARTVEDGVRAVELAWFRVGVTLGWWDREGGLWSAKVKLGAFGRPAAAAMFWSVVDR